MSENQGYEDEVLPEQTTDDTDAREDRSGKGDDWYRNEVPPHHG